MKVNFDIVIRDLKGIAIKDGDIDFRLSDVACTALLAPYPDEKDLDGKTKIRRFKLAEKIAGANGAGVDLSVEDIADLKLLIGKAYAALIVGRAYQILDPEA